MILNVPFIVTVPVAAVVVGVVDVVVTFVTPASVVVATEVGACVVG